MRSPVAAVLAALTLLPATWAVHRHAAATHDRLDAAARDSDVMYLPRTSLL